MIVFLTYLLGCFPNISDDRTNSFVDNPDHDYDGDRLLDNIDCDDSNPDIMRPITYYFDGDGDGFGVVTISETVCPKDKPDQYVESKTRNGVVVFDCDDTTSFANPDGVERCDLLDNNCDTFVDNYDGLDAPLWYADGDGDGFGNIEITKNACMDEDGNGPSNFVRIPGDCDDGDPMTHPFVQGQEGGVEVCDDDDQDENCDGFVNDPSSLGVQLWYQDEDGDNYGNPAISQVDCEQPPGFVSEPTDCNDGNITSNPGATEQCDGVDNDCDGVVDESTATNVVSYYLDSDGDGAGNPNDALMVCPMYQPSNYVEHPTDCNDNNPSHNPSAMELCNGEDDNCDGVIDESSGTMVPLGSPTWYLDIDGDLFGNASEALIQCGQPAGYVENSGDCDDANPLIHPDALEQCTLTIDENCDGDTTYGVLPQDLLEWYPDSDGDGYGNPTFLIRLCEQPQNYVSNPDDCNDTDEWVHPENDALHMTDGVNQSIDSGQGLCSGCQYMDHGELCNGKVDLCNNDLLGDLTPLSDEVDDDGDGYVECSLDVEPVLWEHSTQSISGGEDCDDQSNYRYPNALERCNGIYDDCVNETLIGGLPPNEVDDDNDCFVECSGFDPNLWEGGSHSCSYRDVNYQTVVGNAVMGGDDCNDNSNMTYVGAAPQTNPHTCLTDLDGDGISDRSWNLCNQTMNFGDARYVMEGFNRLRLGGVGNFDGDQTPDFLVGSGNVGSFTINTFPGAFFSESTPIASLSDVLYSETPLISANSDAHPIGVVDDIDGDGLHDFTYAYSWSGNFNGLTSLYFSGDFSASNQNDSQRMYWHGIDSGDSLDDWTNIGDIDQDGLADLLLVADGARHDFVVSGIGYLYFSSTLNLLSGELSLSTADKTFVEITTAKALDIDGDGIKDLLAQTSANNNLYLFLGSSIPSLSNEIFMAQADYTILFNGNTSLYGSVGDIDNDGLEDFMVESNQGQYNIFLGASFAPNSPQQNYEDQRALVFEGQATNNHYDDGFGRSAGDIDGDGLNDLMVKWINPATSTWDLGVFYGSTLESYWEQEDTGLDTGGTDTATMTFQNADVLFQDITEAYSLGDLDQDGLDDLILNNYMMNYSSNFSGVIGIFSACEF